VPKEQEGALRRNLGTEPAQVLGTLALATPGNKELRLRDMLADRIVVMVLGTDKYS
jgi:hypothetical protein